MVGRIFFSPSNRVAQAGFTIIELMVTMGIVGILASIMLANYPELNGRLTLDLLAHDVALSVRQAQQFALGVRQQNVTGLKPFPTYGIHFDTAFPTNYFIFGDVAENFQYDPATDKNLGSGTLPAGMTIKRLCILWTGASPGEAQQFSNCLQGNAGTGQPPKNTQVNSLDFVFKRPNPDASMNGVPFTSSSAFVEGVIILGATRGSAEKQVQVFQSGQISVN